MHSTGASSVSYRHNILVVFVCCLFVQPINIFIASVIRFCRNGISSA